MVNKDVYINTDKQSVQLRQHDLQKRNAENIQKIV